MKIYISEKENVNLKLNKKCELVLVDSKPVISMTEQELNQPIKIVKLLAYSLEEHDKELIDIIKKEMLKAVFAIENICEKKEYPLHFALGVLGGVVDTILKERGVE